MPKVGFFCKAAHPEVGDIARRLGTIARSAGWSVLVEESLAGTIDQAQVSPSKEVAERSDLVVVLGGDGTMIRVIHTLDDRQVPVFGVNLGFLGYLTNFTVDEAEDHFQAVMAGDFETEKRTRLLARLQQKGREPLVVKVINDVVINVSGISRIIEIHTEIDETYLTTFRADGLIVSTPTGSTAYSLSAGGPIVVPWTQAVIITPICPHTLTMRPLVLQEDSVVKLKVKATQDVVMATFDGQQAAPMDAGATLSIQRSGGRVLLVKPPRDYFQILRAKLKWGQMGVDHD